jgi:hypothetical protein
MDPGRAGPLPAVLPLESFLTRLYETEQAKGSALHTKGTVCRCRKADCASPGLVAPVNHLLPTLVQRTPRRGSQFTLLPPALSQESRRGALPWLN